MNSIYRIYDAFEKIRLAKGNEKLSVARIVCKSDEVKRMLIMLLDPACTFGFAEKSLQKKIDPRGGFLVFPSLEDLCIYFSGHSSATDYEVAGVQVFITSIGDPVLETFVTQFLCKTYKLGLTAKSLNKALGYEAIPLIEVMLANKFFDHPKEVEGQAFTITEKLDGIRCVAIVERDGRGHPVVTLWSRQGQPITGLVNIERDIVSLASCISGEFVLDGELLIAGREIYPSAEQYKRTTQIVRTKEGEKHGVDYHVFDLLNLKDFRAKTCATPYYIRRQMLKSLLTSIVDHPHVRIVPVLYSGCDTNMIYRLVEEQRKLQHEGVMVNLENASYVFGRTSHLLKVKVMQDCDLEIVGFEEGSGKFAGTLGALIVEYKGNHVGVGSGLSDSFRAEFWKDPHRYIGRVATIQYFEETHDKNGQPSLRFPVFKEIREEGKEVSYS